MLTGSCRYMECVDLGQAFEDHMVAAMNRLTAPKSQWPGFKEALRHKVAKDKVGLRESQGAHDIHSSCCLARLTSNDRGPVFFLGMIWGL